jgi:hypothetical protein
VEAEDSARDGRSLREHDARSSYHATAHNTTSLHWDCFVPIVVKTLCIAHKQTNKQTNKYSLACRYLSMKVNEAKDILLKKRKTGTQA